MDFWEIPLLVENPDFSHLVLEMSGNLPVNLFNHRTVFKAQMDLILLFLICVIFFKARRLGVFKVCSEGNGVTNLSVIRCTQALLLRQGP